MPSFIRRFVLLLAVTTALCPSAHGGEAKRDRKKTEKADATKEQPSDQVKATSGSSSGSSETGSKSGSATKPKYPPFGELLKDAKVIDGFIKLHRKDTKLYGELTSSNLNKDLIVLISIARGIGETPLLGGMTWGFGDDWIWQFRKVGERIHIIRRNVRFTAAKGSPEEKAVRLAYTDSVLFSLPIATMSPSGGYVVDLSTVLMSDLPQISSILRGFSFSRDKSTWASIKGFKDNIEVQVAATYASGGSTEFDTVADSRGVTINVHYSISRLPQTGYKPRLADDRIGHFLTVVKDYSKESEEDQFVRYVNRWDLRKADSAAKLSPPKTPVIFWLEKTVPYEYRKPIREGILEWNKAFEKAGFVNAVEVRQQPDDAEWDPEDINYNTFRWITSSAGFAMGPSRVNPTTGQILDADIIFDADFLQYWKMKHELIAPVGDDAYNSPNGPLDPHAQLADGLRHLQCGCHRTDGLAQQLALGSLAVADANKGTSEAELKKLLNQAMKEVVMHEVGHTLGLRHNFKGSTYLTLEEINDPKKTAQTGISASVMDYLPVHFAPKGEEQGDYFSTTLGKYDVWAIEYGYKPIAGSSDAQATELNKIASRCAEPGLDYGTDEDTRGYDPDPSSNRFDLGKDPVAFAQSQVERVNQLLPGLVERMTEEGEGYQKARRAFNMLLSYRGDAMYYTARFIGGLYVHRDHRGDPDERTPFVVVPAERQREALELLETEVFGVDSYQFSAELYNRLAPSKWSHWGTSTLSRVDFPVHEQILAWQDRVLSQLMSTTTLSRLLDSELKVPADQDAFTTADLIEGLTSAVFAELDRIKGSKYTNREPAVSSLRRSLQRQYLSRLSRLAMGQTSAPEDCQVVAYAELIELRDRIDKVLGGKARLDTYTEAHLRETSARIGKVLDARLQLFSP